MAHLIRLAAAAMFATAAACAWSEEFPARALTVVVPFPPGGGTDLFARALAQPLSSALGKPVVVDNRSGATGNIGAESVARALADGHTLLYTSASIALSGLVASGNRFDPRRDLAPISMTVSIP